MLEKVRAFVSKEAVLVVAVLAAAVSCALVPFDEGYASYVDWRTLALLFCLMAVVTGLRFMGVMRLLGSWAVSRASSMRTLAFALVALTFVSSMAVTNDVALITFVPLALVVLSEMGEGRHTASVVVLMTVAANLGSMLLPVGNPQNLFLYRASGMGFLQFVLTMAPIAGLSAAMLVAALLIVFRGNAEGHPDCASRKKPSKPTGRQGFLFVSYLLLFALSIMAVVGLIDAFAVAALAVFALLFFDRRTLAKVDYGLLLTFVALFVFVGNMARIPAVHEVLSALVGIAPFYAAVGSSQVISNVPAAVLLSGFTNDWTALIVGTNLGGLGTPIASMASLISLKIATASGLVGKRRYLAVFTGLECGIPCRPMCGKCGIRVGLSPRDAVFWQIQRISKALLSHVCFLPAKQGVYQFVVLFAG